MAVAVALKVTVTVFLEVLEVVLVEQVLLDLEHPDKVMLVYLV